MAEVYPTWFSPIQLGPLTLRNRIAMVPLTRQMAACYARLLCPSRAWRAGVDHHRRHL